MSVFENGLLFFETDAIVTARPLYKHPTVTVNIRTVYHIVYTPFSPTVSDYHFLRFQK